MERINILLPSDLKSAFEKRCREGGVSMATVIRKFVASEVKKPVLMAEIATIANDEKERITEVRKAVAERRRMDIIRAVTVENRRLSDVAKEFKITKSGVSKTLARAGIKIG